MPKTSTNVSAKSGIRTEHNDKFVIRMPYGFRKPLVDIARTQRRSLNAEITLLLEQHVAAQQSAQNGHRDWHKDNSDARQNELDTRLKRKFDNLSRERQQALLELIR